MDDAKVFPLGPIWTFVAASTDGIEDNTEIIANRFIDKLFIVFIFHTPLD